MFGERHYVAVLRALTGLYGAFLTAVILFFDIDSASYLIKWTSVALAALIPWLLWFDRDNKIILWVVAHIDWRNWRGKAEPIDGTWDIFINFPDDSDQHGPPRNETRSGHLKLRRTALGHKIEGTALHDVNQQKTMMHWSSNQVVLTRVDNTQLLIYAYEIYESEIGSGGNPDKVGLVVAGQVGKENEFNGVFHDFKATTPDQTMRRGTVKLIKPQPQD